MSADLIFKMKTSPFMRNRRAIKDMLELMALFANDQGALYVHYQTFADYQQVTTEQIRRRMNILDELDVIAIKRFQGRGKSPHVQINITKFDSEAELPWFGLLQELKPHLFAGKTPPNRAENPTRGKGGPNSKYKLKKGACAPRAATRAANEGGEILMDLPSHDCEQARVLLSEIVERYGQAKATAWIEPNGLSVTAGEGVVWSVRSGFAKARVEGEFSKFIEATRCKVVVA